eukprot:35727-Eustigmatos_ZCMA.PRE.1
MKDGKAGLLEQGTVRVMVSGVHRWRRLQERPDEDEVGAGGLSGVCGHQARIHRVVQPPGQQRRQEPLRAPDL